MYNTIYNFIFVIVSLYFCAKAISYGLYEIKNERNKPGGIAVISFSVLVTAFVNIIIFMR